MKSRWSGTLVIALLMVGVLAGCTTPIASREDLGGLPRADYPEYMWHPLRMIGLGFHFAGNVAEYVAAEPFYFLLAPAPELVGLSLEERRYLEQREEAWLGYIKRERPLVQ